MQTIYAHAEHGITASYYIDINAITMRHSKFFPNKSIISSISFTNHFVTCALVSFTMWYTY